jgi:hypothetical protein
MNLLTGENGCLSMESPALVDAAGSNAQYAPASYKAVVRHRGGGKVDA